jgi:hypothetical protein
MQFTVPQPGEAAHRVRRQAAGIERRATQRAHGVSESVPLVLAINFLPSTSCHQLLAINFLPSTSCHQLLAINFLPSTSCHQLDVNGGKTRHGRNQSTAAKVGK